MSSAPWSVHRFTRDEYATLTELHTKCELIDGEIIDVSPMRHRHAFVVADLVRLLSPLAVEQQLFLSCQTPVVLDDYSEPEPDLWLSALPRAILATRKPNGDELTLVIEVSDTSFMLDRNRKLPAYAAANVPEVWIVDLSRNVVEVHSHPSGSTYGELTTLTLADQLTIPGGATLSIAEFLTPS
jgi:Uma2 family endonuclease